jgi:hypothetical protein
MTEAKLGSGLNNKAHRDPRKQRRRKCTGLETGLILAHDYAMVFKAITLFDTEADILVAK